VTSDKQKEYLGQLNEKLVKEKVVSDANYIVTAKVPIIKIDDQETSTHADVGYGTLSGIINTDYLRCICVVYPRAKFLIFVLKAFLAMREMNEPFKGGLGSYALSLLVISHFQQFQRNFGIKEEDALIGKLLITFFQLYCESPDLPKSSKPEDRPFTFSHFAVSVRANGVYIPLSELRASSKGLFYVAEGSPIPFVEDPLLPGNNVASSCFKYQNIKPQFLKAYQLLTSPIPPPLPPPLYEQCERLVEQLRRRRKKLETGREEETETDQEWERAISPLPHLPLLSLPLPLTLTPPPADVSRKSRLQALPLLTRTSPFILLSLTPMKSCVLWKGVAQSKRSSSAFPSTRKSRLFLARLSMSTLISHSLGGN
jgi:DNA polymerase sigma